MCGLYITFVHSAALNSLPIRWNPSDMERPSGPLPLQIVVGPIRVLMYNIQSIEMSMRRFTPLYR